MSHRIDKKKKNGRTLIEQVLLIGLNEIKIQNFTGMCLLLNGTAHLLILKQLHLFPKPWASSDCAPNLTLERLIRARIFVSIDPTYCIIFLIVFSGTVSK